MSENSSWRPAPRQRPTNTPRTEQASTDASADIALATIIQPQPRWRPVDVREIWRYRHLLIILASRDIKVRYKQTLVGAVWAVLQPLMTMLVFTTLFRLIGHLPVREGVPYAVSVYCGLLPWQLFATSLAQSSESLIADQQLVRKVYFPRVIIPLAPILAALVDFSIALIILVAMMAWYRIPPTPATLALPAFIGFALLAALAAALWLSALNAIYRDIRYVVPFLVQLGMFVSPVVYETAAVIPAHWRPIYSLNPMAGVIDGFRWALLGGAPPPLLSLFLSFTAVIVVLVTGAVHFRSIERTIADSV